MHNVFSFLLESFSTEILIILIIAIMVVVVVVVADRAPDLWHAVLGVWPRRHFERDRDPKLEPSRADESNWNVL